MKILPLASQPSRTSPRRGAFMIVVLVCLIVSGMLLASLLKTALLQDRQLTIEQYRSQSGWLAEAGLERAARRLALAPRKSLKNWLVIAQSRREFLERTSKRGS